jgi:FMN phosphatase YigB (HAD superfamily)
MLDAVFLDLDNTLYLFDEPAFYERFFHRIIPFFRDLIPPDQFEDRLRRALKALQQNDGRVPNSVCFLDTFCYRYRARLPAIWQRFIEFYESEYDHIPVEGKPAPGLHMVIDHLSQKGLTLVVASNPLFPRIAQEKRLAWTGVERKRFNLITHLENMAFVKPNEGYFHQICALLNLAPHHCLMVGNDPLNDMAAVKAGLKTYLTTDARDADYRWETMREEKTVPPSPAMCGPLAALLEAVDRWLD